ncbi:MAG: hypothetical protein KJ057_11950 [Phycisphaerae bacterium]|nr:MAG: hypothetical protein EDS66_08690 [Planctomycetota bacterium]KAB2941288.1 MAG: hypothetical protein F9K17_13235 [Phycisphaerae bacterium]MBE7458433.1 hypothetical protein [Planctomycetia bacterium]MCK6464936.1 hypothetical protein [Phycisphaerae bacterium]MCL4719175.1 hypothetical protein [Phycisphaerae bacterium]
MSVRRQTHEAAGVSRWVERAVRGGVFALEMAALACLPACGGGGGSGNENEVVRRIERVARGGAVALTLSVSDDAPAFDAKVRVQVEATADADTVVRLEDYAAAMERQPFGYAATIVQSSDASPTGDGGRRWVREYELTFLVPGKHVLPGAKLMFIRPPSPSTAGEEADAPPEEEALETESIPLTVRPTGALEVPEEKLGELSTPSPVELPGVGGVSAWWIAGAAVAGCVLIGMRLLMRRRARTRESPAPVPPDVWALSALEALLAERLVECGRVREFYFRLSGIVREFTERRFGLHAPEMTTEEFLRAAMAGAVLGEENRAALGAFLASCDLVKFARFEPDSAAIEQSVETARAFVRAMRGVSEAVCVGSEKASAGMPAAAREGAA